MTPSRKPGRPRDARVDAAILDTVRGVLVERGYAATSMQLVAARAGVGKDTVYRRWSSRAELVYAALFTETESAPPPDTGTLQGDLTAVIDLLQAEFGDDLARAALPSIFAEIASDPRLRELIGAGYLEPAAEMVGEVFARARLRGELETDDHDRLVLDACLGVVLLQVGVLGQPVDPERSLRLAAVLTRGVL